MRGWGGGGQEAEVRGQARGCGGAERAPGREVTPAAARLLMSLTPAGDAFKLGPGWGRVTQPPPNSAVGNGSRPPGPPGSWRWRPSLRAHRLCSRPEAKSVALGVGTRDHLTARGNQSWGGHGGEGLRHSSALGVWGRRRKGHGLSPLAPR